MAKRPSQTPTQEIANPDLDDTCMRTIVRLCEDLRGPAAAFVALALRDLWHASVEDDRRRALWYLGWVISHEALSDREATVLGRLRTLAQSTDDAAVLRAKVRTL